MTQLRTKLGNLATIALVGIPLFAILAVSGWYAAGAWVSANGPPMPATGYVAMTLGVVFSVVVGCGLMALVFYSNRHGYDDAAQDATQDATHDVAQGGNKHDE
jgi:cation transporter-like permease